MKVGYCYGLAASACEHMLVQLQVSPEISFVFSVLLVALRGVFWLHSAMTATKTSLA